MSGQELYSKVGPYILMQTIGVGSFGKVKLAVHETTYERYACKILDKRLVKERVLSLQVQKEIDIMRRLRHRNTVALVSVLSTPSKVFIIMELVNGGELFDEILRHKRLQEPYARFYFRQLIEGLQHCHDHGVYHRDLKPENLLLDEDGTLKITDFGLSTLKAGASMAGSDAITGSLTLHTQCGTPNYVAPEIIRLRSEGYSGAKVDAWSCGIILYVLVAGSLPFDANEMDVLFKLILRCDLNYPSYFSDSLIDLIQNLLRTEPKERFSLADVRQHEWYNGPIESSMTSNDDTFTPSTTSTVPSSPSLSSKEPESPRSLSPDPFSTTREPRQASLLSQFKMEKPDFKNSIMRRKDSLDIEIRAETVDCEIPLTRISSSQNAQTQSNPVTSIVSSSNDENIESIQSYDKPNPKESIPSLNPVNTAIIQPEPLPKNINDANIDPVARFKSRVLGESNGNYAPSSDDDHESEFEEAQELFPGCFFNKQADDSVQGLSPGTSKVRRTQSLNDFDVKNPNSNSQEPNDVAAMDRPGKRGRLKRQLWDNAAQTWKVPSHSFHFTPLSSNRVISKQVKASYIRSQNCDPLAGTDNMLPSSTFQTAGIRKSHSCAGETTSLAAQLNEKPARVRDGKLSAVPSQLASSPSLTRSNSHDGYITPQPTRRRARSRSRTKTGTPSALANGDFNLLPNEVRQKPIIPANGNVSKAILQNKETSSKKRRQKPGVRFQDQNQEILVDRVCHGDENWVRSDSDRMIWCRMMQDYDMIPDELEFGLDSATLNEKWREGLEAENLGRKGGFSAYRFGSSMHQGSGYSKRLRAHTRAYKNSGSKSTRNGESPMSTRKKSHHVAKNRRRDRVILEEYESGADSPLEHSSTTRETKMRVLMNDSSSGEPNIKTPSTKERMNGVKVSTELSPSPITPVSKISSIPPAPNDTDTTVTVKSHGEGESNVPSAIPPHMVLEATLSTLPASGEGSPSTITRSSKNSYDSDSGQIEEDTSSGTTRSSKVQPAPVERLGRSECSSNDSSSARRVGPGKNDLLPSYKGLIELSKNSVETDYRGSYSAEGDFLLRSGSTNTTTRSSEHRGIHNYGDQVFSEGSISSSSGAHGHSTYRSRSDGKSLNSDSGVVPSPVGSTYSACLRSIGSDGLMLTPRELDGLDETIPNGDPSNYIISGTSTASDVDGSRRDGELGQNVSEEPTRSIDIITISESIRPTPQVLKKEMERAPIQPYDSLPKGNGRDPISPFALDIPGPKGLASTIPGAKPRLGGIIPNVPSAKKLLRKANVPLDVKRYTQFHSLLSPPDCVLLMRGILTEYGCRITKDISAKSKARYKLKCEIKEGNTSIATTMIVYKLDDELCAVLFKKRSNVDGEKFLEFYSNVYKRYCEKAISQSHTNDCPQRRRRKSPARVRFDSPASSGTGVRSITTRSMNGRDDSIVPTESTESGVVQDRNSGIECVTLRM